MAKPRPATATMALAWLETAPLLLVVEGLVPLVEGVVPLVEGLGTAVGLVEALGETAPVELAALVVVATAAVVVVVVVTGSAAKATVAMTARTAAAENFMVGGSGVGVGLVLGLGWLVWKWNEVRKSEELIC